MLQNRRFAWKKDLPDRRDYKFSAILKEDVLPSSVDLRPNCSAVDDQGNLGSCTAQSVTGAVEFLDLKAGNTVTDLSRLFLYWNTRKIERTVTSDSGASLRDTVKSVRMNGVCAEKIWPYIIRKFKVRPPLKCYIKANAHKAVTYYRINNLIEMKNCLASGFPFVFGFAVYDSFISAEVERTGIVNIPGLNENLLGGHAVMAVGYDDATQRFLIKNSWGINWGVAGYFTMPYEYLTDANLAGDFWTIQKTLSGEKT